MPAGSWDVIADGIIVESVDMTFDLIQRRGTTDTVLVEWTQHFDPKPNNDFTATTYEVQETALAIDFEPGDQLVYKYAGANSAQAAYFPAADGSSGRDTQLILPFVTALP